MAVGRVLRSGTRVPFSGLVTPGCSSRQHDTPVEGPGLLPGWWWRGGRARSPWSSCSSARPRSRRRHHPESVCECPAEDGAGGAARRPGVAPASAGALDPLEPDSAEHWTDSRSRTYVWGMPLAAPATRCRGRPQVVRGVLVVVDRDRGGDGALAET